MFFFPIILAYVKNFLSQELWPRAAGLALSHIVGSLVGHQGWLEELDLAFTVCVECSCNESQFSVASLSCNLRLFLCY